MAHGILVPLDGSALAARALPYASLLAERCGAELLLAEIVAPTPRAGEDAEEARDRAFAEAAERLAARQQPLRTRGLAVETLTAGGDPAGALMDIARARDVALIVMATRGRSGPARWVLGSVAERLLRATGGPVLLLTPLALEAGGPERLGERLLCPVEDSPLSEAIFPIAQALAHCLTVPVTLVRALDLASMSVPPSARLAPYGIHTTAQLHQQLRDDAAVALDALASEWRRGGYSADTLAVPEAPVEGILRAAAQSNAGWLAMASRGRGPVGELLLGSTALALLQRTTLPLLIAARRSPGAYRLGAAP